MLLYTNITINVNFGLIAILVYKNMYLISFIKSMGDFDFFSLRKNVALSVSRAKGKSALIYKLLLQAFVKQSFLKI